MSRVEEVKESMDINMDSLIEFFTDESREKVFDNELTQISLGIIANTLMEISETLAMIYDQKESEDNE